MIINVDDLGLSPAVNEAVLLLAEKQRIQSSSFMSFGQIDSATLTALQRLTIDIGLHLDFTELVKEMTDFGSLKQLIRAAWLRQLSKATVTEVIQRQLDLFEDKIGRVPAFVDGHQHVHQFPVIREILLEQVQKRYAKTVPMRSTRPTQTDVKSRIIYALGGRRFDKLCRQSKIPMNNGFAGVYDFNADEQQLSQYWQQWLRTTHQHAGLIMCHPAVPDNRWSDSIRLAREREFAWLSSDAFGQLLAANSSVLEQWSAAS